MVRIMDDKLGKTLGPFVLEIGKKIIFFLELLPSRLSQKVFLFWEFPRKKLGATILEEAFSSSRPSWIHKNHKNDLKSVNLETLIFCFTSFHVSFKSSIEWSRLSKLLKHTQTLEN